MKVGDLVRITATGRWNLNHVSRDPGIVVDAKESSIGTVEIVYVSWPNGKPPRPISVRWLEKIK